MHLRTGMFHLASWLLLNRPTSMFITKRNVFVSPLYHTMKIEVVVVFFAWPPKSFRIGSAKQMSAHNTVL